MKFYQCVCGYRFTTYDEYFELVDRHAGPIGIGCAKCGREVKPECQSCEATP